MKRLLAVMLAMGLLVGSAVVPVWAQGKGKNKSGQGPFGKQGKNKGGKQGKGKGKGKGKQGQIPPPSTPTN